MDFETLADYYAGQLDEAQQQQVEAWLSEHSSDDARWLRAFQAISGQVTFPTLSTKSREELTSLFAASQRQARPAGSEPERPSLRRRLVATLSFDSWSPQLATATRATQSEMRQLLYETEAATLALDIAPHAGRLTLSGQVLFEEEWGDERCLIQLIQDDVERAAVESDAFNEFVIESLAPGVYQIVVSHSHFELITEQVNLT